MGNVREEVNKVIKELNYYIQLLMARGDLIIDCTREITSPEERKLMRDRDFEVLSIYQSIVSDLEDESKYSSDIDFACAYPLLLMLLETIKDHCDKSLEHIKQFNRMDLISREDVAKYLDNVNNIKAN